MFVGSPVRELREIAKYLWRVSVEDVRSIDMDKNAGGVLAIKGVAADVRSAIYEQDAPTEPRRETFRQHRAGKACPHDKIVVGRGTIQIVGHVLGAMIFPQQVAPCRYRKCYPDSQW